MVAVVTPHLGSMVSPIVHADAATAVRVIQKGASAPVIVAAPLPPGPTNTEQAPAYSIAVTSDLVAYGDTKTSDFDPEHPPADMGEAG
jgi:hypothetical protein